MPFGRILCGCLAGAALLGPVGPLRAREPERAEARLARLDREIERRSAELNAKYWGCYLDYAEAGRITPQALKFPGLELKALCDSVPRIAALEDSLKVASAAYKEVLRSDPQYEAIHNEYVALKGTSDQARNDANAVQYNQLYARLRRDNPAYAPALERWRAAERRRNIEILRTVAVAYRRQRRIMPLQPIIGYYDQRILRERCPEVQRMEKELDQLRKLRDEMFEQMQRKEFGME